MKPLIFDSSALLTYFLGEEGKVKVQELLKTAVQENVSLLLSPINLGEIYYIVSRRDGETMAESVIKMLDELFFENPPVDKQTSISAAKLKAKYRLGYADAFAVALALEKNGELVTGDKDFEPFEKMMKIHWI